MSTEEHEPTPRPAVPEPRPESGGLNLARKIALFAILAILGGSILARGLVGDPPATVEPVSTSVPAGLQTGQAGILPGLGGSESAEDSTGQSGASDEFGLRDALPYLTEGSFFALIGFALGYASKKILKLALIGLAIFFAALQGLSIAEVVQIDWDRALDLANDLVFNLKENESWGQMLTDRIPTVGSLAGGFVFGFRKG